LASSGSLEQNEKKSYKFEPLVTSSSQSALIPTSKLKNLSSPDMLLEDFIPLKPYTLAVRVTGKFETAFPNGKPQSGLQVEPADKNGDSEKKIDASDEAFLKQAKEETSVIVFGDSDIFDDRFWLQTQEVSGQLVAVPYSDNGNFVLNALDSLTGTQGLSYLRGQGTIARPFEKLEDVRRKAEEMYLKEEKILNQRIEDTQKRLQALQSETDPARMALSTEQQKREIENFTKDLVSSRQALREVKKNLNNELSSIQDKIRILNIGVVPLALGLLVTALLTLRQRRYGLRKPKKGAK